VETTGTLRDYVNNNPSQYGHLVDGSGDWVVRNDVWVWAQQGGYGTGTRNDEPVKTGFLTPGFGASASQFGPELGFGNVIGDAYDEQVVLVKTAWGGASLYENFLPPSAAARRGETTGDAYTQMLASYQQALTDIAAQFPSQDIELIGMAWHQGFNDRLRNNNFTEADQPFRQYEMNLEDLIKDVRTDLGEADLPFVVATTSMGTNFNTATDVGNRTVTLENGQLAVADDSLYPEFAGTVGSVLTRDFYRDAVDSPRNQGYHWNQNGETYYLIGEGLGEEMLAIVPEPSSLALLGLGGLLIARRRRS
jgi:alpha-galactosidase